jgi:hypothetical protein
MIYQVDDPGYCPHCHQQLPWTTSTIGEKPTFCNHRWLPIGNGTGGTMMRCGLCGRIEWQQSAPQVITVCDAG